MKTEQIVLSGPSVDEAVLAPLARLAPQLVLVFGSVDRLGQPGFLDQIKAACPQAHWVGCSTAGEISRSGVTEKSCVLTGVRFDGGVHLKIAETQLPGMEASEMAGGALGKALAAPDLRAVMLFGKGVNVNGSAIIEGLVSEVGRHVPITGGLAGDDGAFQRTLTVSPAGVQADGLVGIGFYGDGLVLGHGSYGGWKPFGPARKVTRSSGNILYELDGEPALNIYKRYLGDYAKDLPGSGLLFPFEMLDGQHTANGLIRTILGVDEASGSLVLAGDVDPEGYLRLMHASTADLVNGAEEAAESTLAQLGSGAQNGLAVLVSCVGRRLVMGDEVDEEVEAVADVLGRQNMLTGFYSYGEISPYSSTTDCKLHNQTMTVTYLSER